jgi:threonine synthase
VKALFSDEAFKDHYQLGAINSINWARILAQTTYYFASYFALMKRAGYGDIEKFSKSSLVQYSVPSGNFGDVLAGFFAQRMGLPIDKLIVATNENDILDRFFKTGRYDKKLSTDKDPVKMTLSPAMDILLSSNFERLLWYLVETPGQNIRNNSTPEARRLACQKIHGFMSSLKTENQFTVSQEVLEIARKTFTSFMVSDVATSECIREYYHNQFSSEGDSSSYVLDPHTAVGVYAAERIIEQDSTGNAIHTICLSTASPGKFPEAVLGAINAESVQPALEYKDIAPKALVELEGLPQRFTMVKNNGDKLKALNYVRSIISKTISI